MAEPTFEEQIDPELLAQLEELDPEFLAQLQSVEADPTLLERGVSRYGVDTELTPPRLDAMGELTDIGLMLEGSDAGGFDKFSQGFLNMTTMDPMELADILTSRFPEDIKVTLSPEGVPVATNLHTGKEVVINKPGFSPMDVLQGIGLVGLYSPAGEFARMPFRAAAKTVTEGAAKKAALKSASRKAAGRGVLAEGATEYGLQKAQEMAGGRMDPGEVAFSAATALVPEYVMTPIGSGMRKTADIIKDNVVIPDGIRLAIDYARKTGRKIATSDVLAETIKAPRKVFLKGAERIPLIGTSGMRLRQAKERVDSLESIFSHFGLYNADYSQYIVGAFNQQSRRVFAGINKLRTESFELMKGTGSVPPKSFMNMIDEELERASKLEPDQRRSLMNYLNSVRQDFEGVVDGSVGFNFKDADLFLNSLMEEAGKGGLKGDMKRRLGEGLTKDMKRHALSSDSTASAFTQWDLARNLGLKEMKAIEDKALREAVKTGVADAALIDRLLATGRTNDLNSLYKHTNETGHELLRMRTMAEVFRKAGGDLDNLLETVNPDKLVQILKHDKATRNLMKKFWSPDDRDMVMGWMNYLEQTNESAKAFAGVGMLAAGASAGGGKKMIAGALAALLPPTWAIVSAARTHESDLVRDLLLQLHHAEPASMAARAINAELRPLVLSIGQQVLSEGRDPFTPAVEPTMFEKFIGGTGVVGGQLWGTGSEFVAPAVEGTMKYLRGVTGIGEEEEAAP